MKINRAPLTLALAAIALAGALSGCAPLIIGGAAVGTMVAFDRRTSGAQLDDEGIELRAISRLRDALADRGHVNTTSYNRQVLLTGEVPTEQLKQTAEQVVSRVDNVKGIVNELAVMPNTTLAQRANDTLITGKVKAGLVDDRDLYVGAFKVVTERNTVYLMGRVTQREADKASQIARTTSGVQRVVRIFEIVTDEELRRLVPPVGRVQGPPPAAAQPSSRPAAPATTAPAASPSAAPEGATTSPATRPAAAPTTLPPLNR
jgi:osmotically-inducible protein OsmY